LHICFAYAKIKVSTMKLINTNHSTKSNTMKLHHTKYKKNYLRYLSQVMETEDCRYPIQEALEQIFERFYKEMNVQADQHSMTHWLQGLAIPIACYNYEILQLAKDMGSCDDVLTDRQEDLICNNYFSFMANIILAHEPKYDIIRHYKAGGCLRIRKGGYKNLTIVKARQHCTDPATSTDEYFDGYDYTEKTKKQLRFK